MSDPPEQRFPRIAVSVVVRRHGAVLLVRRSKAPNAGRWSLPGGRVEYGETLRAAAARELFEETGIVAEIGEPLAVFELFADGPPSHFVLHTFAADYRSGEPIGGDDALAARFVSEGDLDRLDVIAEVRQAIAMGRP